MSPSLGCSAVRWSWWRQWVLSLPSGVVRARCWLACGILPCDAPPRSRPLLAGQALPSQLQDPVFTHRFLRLHLPQATLPLSPCFRSSFDTCCPSLSPHCALTVSLHCVPPGAPHFASRCPHCVLQVPSLSLQVPLTVPCPWHLSDCAYYTAWFLCSSSSRASPQV